MARISIGARRSVSPPPRPAARKGGVDLLYNPLPWDGPQWGTYNPNILYEVEKGQRGLEDLLEKQEHEAHEQHVDVGQKVRELARGRRQGLGDLSRQRGYAQTDTGYKVGQLGINFSRDIGDLTQARQRGEQDYSRQLTDLQHRYGSQAEQQQQAQVQQGTDEAGTNAASAAVRGANQAYDKSGLDLSHERSEQDFNTRESRLGQDYGSDLSRTNEGLARQLVGYAIQGKRLRQSTRAEDHAVGRAARRATQARSTQASQSTREQIAYERNAQEDAFYEAHQLHPGIVFPGSQPDPGAAPASRQHPQAAAGFAQPHVPAPPVAPHVGAAVATPRYPGQKTYHNGGTPAAPRRRYPVGPAY